MTDHPDRPLSPYADIGAAGAAFARDITEDTTMKQRTNQHAPPRHPRTRSDWTQWLRQDMKFARERLIATGELHQMAVLHKRRGEMVLLSAPFRDETHRQSVLSFLRIACIAHDAIGLSMITEAWQASVERWAGESEAAFVARASETRARLSETRREVISVTLTYRDDADQCQAIGDVAEIVRDAEGRATGVRPVRDGQTGSVQMTGASAQILPDASPTPDERARASDLLARFGAAIMAELGIA